MLNKLESHVLNLKDRILRYYIRWKQEILINLMKNISNSLYTQDQIKSEFFVSFADCISMIFNERLLNSFDYIHFYNPNKENNKNSQVIA